MGEDEHYENLIEATEKVIKAFNPVVMTIDSHAEEMIGVDNEDPDVVFVKQVFYGCVRYKSLLKTLLSSFYHDNSGTTLRSDYTMYMIVTYLGLFRLDELKFDEFKNFISTQDPAKMYGFLSYMLNPEILIDKVRDEWSKIYDLNFIDNELIDRINRYKEEIESCKSHLSAVAFGIQKTSEKDSELGMATDAPLNQPSLASLNGSNDIKNKIPTTVVQPFNLTKPKKKEIPEPIRIPLHVKAKPVPDLNTTTLSIIEDESKKRKEQLLQERKEYYENNPVQPFILGENRISRTTKDILEEKERKESELEKAAATSKAKAIPNFNKIEAPVRLNVASILREDALYKKKQEDEAKAIKAYESELRDSTEFLAWQHKMKGIDAKARKDAIEKRRMDMKVSQKHAVLASSNQKLENRIVASRMKLEAETLLKKVENEKLKDIELNKELAEKVKEIREIAPREAEKKVLKKNKRRRDIAKRESGKRVREKAAADALEQEIRNDLIRQIRALERVPKRTIIKFDPTESSGVGLLEEMSLVELKERLRMNKIRDAEWKEEQRQNIVSKKREKEIDLKHRIDTLHRIRAAKAVERKELRIKKKRQELEERVEYENKIEEENLVLAKRLKQKFNAIEAEKNRLQAEEAEIEKKRMFLGAAKSMIEKKRFGEQLKGAEREARERQEKDQYAAKYNEETKKTEKSIKQYNSRRSQAIQKQMKVDFSRELEASKQELAERQHAEMLRKKFMFKEERRLAASNISYRKTLNKYATDISENSVTRGKINSMRRAKSKYSVNNITTATTSSSFE